MLVKLIGKYTPKCREMVRILSQSMDEPMPLLLVPALRGTASLYPRDRTPFSGACRRGIQHSLSAGDEGTDQAKARRLNSVIAALSVWPSREQFLLASASVWRAAARVLAIRELLLRGKYSFLSSAPKEKTVSPQLRKPVRETLALPNLILSRESVMQTEL
jgi:hypothetical protein